MKSIEHSRRTLGQLVGPGGIPLAAVILFSNILSLRAEVLIDNFGDGPQTLEIDTVGTVSNSTTGVSILGGSRTITIKKRQNVDGSLKAEVNGGGVLSVEFDLTQGLHELSTDYNGGGIDLIAKGCNALAIDLDLASPIRFLAFTVSVYDDASNLWDASEVLNNPGQGLHQIMIPFEGALLNLSKVGLISTRFQFSSSVAGGFSVDNFRFINTNPSTIVIKKETNPSNINTDHEFGISGASFAESFSLNPALQAERVFENLPVGTYTVFEFPSESTTLTEISCSGINGTGLIVKDLQSRHVTFRLEAGQTVTCTFHNAFPVGDRAPSDETASLSGRVWKDNDCNLQYDTHNYVFLGLTIWLFNDQGDVIKSTRTGPDGQYQFDELDPGTYQIKADGPFIVPRYELARLADPDGIATPDIATVSVDAGEDLADLDFLYIFFRVQARCQSLGGVNASTSKAESISRTVVFSDPADHRFLAGSDDESEPSNGPPMRCAQGLTITQYYGEPNPEELSIAFSVCAGKDYSIEFCDALATGIWQPLPDAPHNAGQALDRATSDQRFYRIRVEKSVPANGGD